MPILFPSRPPAPDVRDEAVAAGREHVERGKAALNLYFWESLGSYITLQAFATLFDTSDYKRPTLTQRQARRVRNYMSGYGLAMQAVEEAYATTSSTLYPQATE